MATDVIARGLALKALATNANGIFSSGVTITGGFLYETSAVGIVAGTTRTLAGATVLTAEINRIDTSTAPANGSVLGDGVALPVPTSAGLDVTVINNTLNIISVYPATASDRINGQAVGTPVPIPPGDIAHFECTAISPSDWRVEAGVGTAGYIDTTLPVDNISAAGTNQATATLLPGQINRITGGTGGVMLPAGAAGLDLYVINHAGIPVQVYGTGTDTVDDLAGSTGATQMNGSLCLYSCASTGKWYSNGIGTGYAGSLPTFSYTDNVLAVNPVSQTTATPITTTVARFGTVNAAGAAATLPTAAPGVCITVINATINPLTIFPINGGTDAINGLAANASVVVPGNTIATFDSTLAGVWTSCPFLSASGATSPYMSSMLGSAATGAARPGGNVSVSVNATGQGNGIDTTDDVIATYQLPASAFDVANRQVAISFAGKFAANANNKRVKVWWGTTTQTLGAAVVGGTLIADSGLVATNGSGFSGSVTVTKYGAAGSNTQISTGAQIVAGPAHTGTSAPALLTAAENAVINITVTGSSPTTGAANDVTGQFLQVAFAN